MTTRAEIHKKIEKNGLMVIAVASLLIYWTIDTISGGSLANRILITIFILVYGTLTQFLLNRQKAVTDSLQQARNELALANQQLVHVNAKLELAYAWMRDNRDELKQQMYEEDIGFLVDQDGKIEGVTERALLIIKKKRDGIADTDLTQLAPENARDDFRRALKEAWKGITHQTKCRITIPEVGEKELDMKFTRITLSGKRLLLVILN